MFKANSSILGCALVLWTGSAEAADPLDLCTDSGAAAIMADTPYMTVQEAVYAAAPDATIWLCPGNHAGNIELELLSATFRAADPTPGSTVIGTRGGSYIGFLMRGGRGTLRFMDLTFEGGTAGAISTWQGDVVEIDHCVFRNNRDSSAGAVYIHDGSALRIYDSVFEGNEATADGGAIYYSTRRRSELTVERSVFRDNTSATKGGAIRMFAMSDGGPRAEVRIVDTTFEGNTDHVGAGALYLRSSIPVEVDIRSSTFVGNTSRVGPGAIQIDDNTRGTTHFSRVLLADSVVTDNTSTDGYQAVNFVSGGHFTMRAHRTAFLRNSSNGTALFVQRAVTGQFGLFESLESDFGTGADDNLAPFDAIVLGRRARLGDDITGELRHQP